MVEIRRREPKLDDVELQGAQRYGIRDNTVNSSCVPDVARTKCADVVPAVMRPPSYQVSSPAPPLITRAGRSTGGGECARCYTATLARHAAATEDGIIDAASSCDHVKRTLKPPLLFQSADKPAGEAVWR